MLVCACILAQFYPAFSILYISVLAASAGLEIGTYSYIIYKHILSLTLWGSVYIYLSLHLHKPLIEDICINMQRKVFSETPYSLMWRRWRNFQEVHLSWRQVEVTEWSQARYHFFPNASPPFLWWLHHLQALFAFLCLIIPMTISCSCVCVFVVPLVASALCHLSRKHSTCLACPPRLSAEQGASPSHLFFCYGEQPWRLCLIPLSPFLCFKGVLMHTCTLS